MNKVVGILGGGQLGRMLAQAASLLNIDVVSSTSVTTPRQSRLSPSVCDLAHIDGSFTDPAKIRELAAKVDVLTVEIEHVDVDVLQSVQGAVPLGVHPSPSTIRVIQDKLVQKEHLVASGCPVSQFLQVESTVASVTSASETLGLPLMLKSRTLAYDGRGNYVAIAALGGRPLYAEKWVPFVKEIAVMVVRSATGEIASYPVVETVHRDNICHLVFAPLRSSDGTLSGRARDVAEASVKTLEGAGVFGVEMFLVEDDVPIRNHLRAILSLPLGSTALKVPSAAMLNLLGASGDVTEISAVVEHALKVPGAAAHLYGKSECRKGRKMGHITVVAPSDAERSRRLRPLLERLPSPSSAAELALHAPLAPEPGSGFSHRQPLVGIIMGSDSDLPVMVPSARILDRFGIPYELTIVSAHRTPDRMTMYARSAVSRGLRVIIAGAGGAAHLPGMVAAMTSLPVVGVPVKGSTLDGVDSLHSIVQMPRGVPVATVAINNSMNAGLLAVRILASGMPDLVHKMDDYLTEQACEVQEKVQKLEVTGWERYVS
ncbi:AIR carboxylase-domain-containing protein [Fomitopsis serialis]|uniref:AIR carboxylase-domain-containing protein n=1 Tax=Fomitopsis serialis TaxID=139415 RepID=UPI002008840D|nr:AIR carboxylase-domain-containing protein [Neoantrodia serialis]KAH9920767.1 AIR carboxylase-domain-containing protein [Neoantrodia serialis]